MLSKLMTILKEPTSLLGLLGGGIGLKQTGALDNVDALAPLLTGPTAGWLMVIIAVFAIANKEGQPRG
jgi:hypothetical protein|tara:strand:+ start:7155 stop:7358 length:204 start_codon:yes stop_codon:yes gene_type:complete